MSGQRSLHLDSSEAEQSQRDKQVVPRARQFSVGDPVPRVLTLRQLAANLQISERALLSLRKSGTHPGVRQLEGPGDPRFCGVAFKRWSDGAHEESATRSFFGGARRRG